MQEVYNNIEKEFIAECLHNSEVIANLRAKLLPQAFFDQSYKEIYKKVLEMNDEGAIVRPYTVQIEIENEGSEVLLQVYESLEDLKEHHPSDPKVFNDYVGRLNDRFQKAYASKELANASDKIRKGEPIQDVFTQVEDRLRSASMQSRKPFRPFAEVIRDEMGGIMERSSPGYDIDSFYVPVPFQSMKPFLKGFRYGALSLLGARPSHGKTTFALNCINHAVRSDVKTMLVSIEMTESEIAQKILSMNTAIPTSNLIQSSSLTEEDLEVIDDSIQRTKQQFALNFSIDDTSESPSDVMRCIQRAINDGHRLIVIDHLHELAFDERRSHISLQEAMGNFVKRLRNMAKKYNVAILALCQLNRDVEKRAQRTPVMSDLGETGALERAAFNILFLYRDEVYSPGGPRKGECDVIVAKARDSRTGLVTLNFRGDINRFKDQ